MDYLIGNPIGNHRGDTSYLRKDDVWNDMEGYMGYVDLGIYGQRLLMIIRGQIIILMINCDQICSVSDRMIVCNVLFVDCVSEPLLVWCDHDTYCFLIDFCHLHICIGL